MTLCCPIALPAQAIGVADLQPLCIKKCCKFEWCSGADPKTDVAATILRMLYIRDLRGLQSTIDQTLVEVQVRSKALLLAMCCMD